MAFDFEQLNVYKKAVNFAGTIYKVTKNFPQSETSKDLRLVTWCQARCLER